MRKSQFITKVVDISSLSHEQLLKHFSEFDLHFSHQSGEDNLYLGILVKTMLCKLKFLYLDCFGFHAEMIIPAIVLIYTGY